MDADLQATDCKNTIQRKLILPGPLQAPDHGDGQQQDDEVHNDIEALVDDEEQIAIEAVAVDASIPVGPQRPTLQGAGKEDASGPGSHEAVEDKRDAVELRCGENTAVEAHEGYLDGGG